MKRTTSMVILALATACGGTAQSTEMLEGRGATPVSADLRRPEETHLADIVQLTRGSGENAEAYWSSDGSQLVFQSTRPPYSCDQIMRIAADGSAPAALVSTGKGRTTCSFFFPGDDRVLWSSTHHVAQGCPPPPDMSRGYVWAIYDSYDIFTSRPDGSDIRQLTDTPGYDAEATICRRDGSIVFTSMRDGDLELYRMDADGKNVVRLTNAPGYDGGAFFSADCTQLVWRASRPTGKDLEDYRGLLARGLVRPSRMEIFVADADGSNARQLTYLGAGSFAPYFYPSGDRILFASNTPDPRGREFDLWAIDVTGANLERITYAEGFDSFPMFSPDGSRLVFASNRNNVGPNETDLFVSRWVDGPARSTVELPADRFLTDVRWLADDARQGRGIGTAGLDESARWLVDRMKDLGVQGGLADGAFLQELPVAVDIRVSRAELTIGRQQLAADDFVPASFSGNGRASGRTVFVGYGVTAKDLGIDDYAGKKVKGKIAVALRFLPRSEKISETMRRRYSELHHKAFTAREHGATALIVVDLPDVRDASKITPQAAKQFTAEEAPLPQLTLTRLDQVGIPVVIAKRAAAAKLVTASFPAVVRVELEKPTRPAHNVVGVIPAGIEPAQPGAVVIGAHYDHLGLGGPSSLDVDKKAPHNGADDNASGTAGLLEVARRLQAVRSQLRRPVLLVAFTAEETGLLGSSYFVNHLADLGLAAQDVVAMVNMDMIGRLRNNTVSVLGGGTADEWNELVSGACADASIQCNASGSGYGPSDQTPFYASGVPVLHFFTGAHGDYHKTSDDWHKINAAGGAQVAAAVANVALRVADRQAALTYRRVAEPPPAGDTRSFGASLGTIPDYAADESVPGVLLSGVRPGGAAERAGIQAKDRILRIGDTDVRTVQDLVYVLRQAKPGEKAVVVFERDGKRRQVEVTFGESGRR
jgi:Tol biopolymer transport system component